MSVDYSRKIQDLRLGEKGECEVLKRLIQKFGEGVKKYQGTYSLKDFYLTNKKGKVIQEWELKTRRVSKDKYPTTAFGLNKYEHSVRALPNCKQTYLFNFTDGLYYWDLYNPELQSNEFEFGEIANRRRGGKPHTAVFVLKNYLKRFN